MTLTDVASSTLSAHNQDLEKMSVVQSEGESQNHQKILSVPSNHTITYNTTDLQTTNKFSAKSTILKVLTTLGLIFGIFIGTINETAVSTVTETIAKDLNAYGSLTWIAGSYLLTVVAFTPLFGKLSDIFGRKPVEMFCIATFAIGCLGCALADSMVLLIVFRAIAGIGGGGLMSMSFIMASDVIPIQQRATYLGMISLTYAVSQILGPILGGIIAESSWRIAFYWLAGMCIVLAVLVIFVLDLPPSEGDILSKVKRVDFLGSISLIVTMITLILATSWGGHDYAWNSPTIIVLFVVMVISFLSFLLVQWKVAAEPILPARVFVRKVILCNVANFTSGAINIVAVFYLPVYFQTVHDATPSQSGYKLIPFLVTISLFCVASGYFFKIFKTIRGIMWVGGVINTIGVCLVAFMRQNSSTAEQVIFEIINGMGLGMIFQLAMLTCQMSVMPEDVAIVSGFFTFILNIGGVIGLTIVGSVYNNVLLNQISTHLPNFSPRELLVPDIARTLNEENRQILKYCYWITFRYSYICMIPFAVIGLLSVLALPKIPLPDKDIQPSTHT